MTSTGLRPAAETSRFVLDRSIETLRSNAGSWSDRSIGHRIEDLVLIRRRMMEVAPDLVAASVDAKGLSADMAGEEWVVGPLTVLRTLRFLQETLEGIRSTGEVPLPDSAVRERPDGQVVVDVLPADRWDRILYRGWQATVRMDREIGLGRARRNIGGIHTKPDTARSAVALILGAGNVASIAPLDLAHKLFAEGHVALLKFNPVNAYIGPFIEHAFSHLMAEGFVRTCHGGVEVGEYLVAHPGVDEIHITGSARSHDAIVFGPGPEGARRKAGGTPRLTKPITSELGNVSPVIVAPGRWNAKQIDHQAEHVATQLLQNAGYNCNAAKVLVLPRQWDQGDEFLGAIGAKLASRPDRPAYYPGSLDRYQRILDSGGIVTTFGESADGVPATIVDVAESADHAAFSEEAFCRVMAVVRLDGSDPSSFLHRAVPFANERLAGTLNATVLADPGTIRSHGAALEWAIDELRFGTVGFNLWAAAGFPLGVTPWGAYPGHTMADIGSGIGFVHNARLIDRPEKTVIRAPFTIVPKPTWSVFHRNAAEAMRRATAFEASPSLVRLPGLLAAAVRA